MIRPFFFVLLAAASITPVHGEQVPLSHLNIVAMTAGWGTPKAGRDVAGAR